MDWRVTVLTTYSIDLGGEPRECSIESGCSHLSGIERLR
jgi:hypothetical protein